MRFGWKQYFEPTPKNVQKALRALKGVIGAAALSAWAQEEPGLAFWMLVGGALLDEAAKYLGSDEPNPINQNNPDES